MDEEKLSKIISLDKTLQACKSAREFLSEVKTGAIRISVDTSGSPGLIVVNSTLGQAFINGLMIIAADVEQHAYEHLERIIG